MLWTINYNGYARDQIRGRCKAHFFPYDYFEDQIMEKFTKDISKQLEKLRINIVNK